MLLKNSAGEKVFSKIKPKKVDLVIIVIIVFILILILFGGINIYNCCKIINKQTNSNLIYLTNSIKHSENVYFHSAEVEVEHYKNTIELTINLRKLNAISKTAYKYNKYQIPYVKDYLNSIVSPLLLYSAQNVEGIISTYFIFDYKFLVHKEMLGLWYTNIKDKKQPKITDNGPVSEMYPEDSQNLEWYYDPKKFKKGLWSSPYIDKDIKINMITYSTPVFSGGKFIGIAGADISIEEIKNFIYKFKIYKTGKAYLIDKNNKIIFAKNYKTLTSTREIDKNLWSFLNKVLENNNILKDDDIKLFKSSSAKKLFAVTKLYNGFILVLEVPVIELYGEINKLVIFTSFSLLFAILIVILVSLVAYAKVKKINNELLHKEKLISMGTMAAEVAHEINNPLGYISCNIETLKKFLEKIKTFMLYCEDNCNKVVSGEITLTEKIEHIHNLKEEFKIEYILNSLDDIIEESKNGIKRVSALVVSLKNFSKDDSQTIKSKQNLIDIIEESLKILNGKLVNNIELIKIFHDIPPLYCNKNQLKQALINIIDNSYQALEEKNAADKKIIISIYKKGKNACIDIEDNGMGIEKKKINKIFDAFFTTKSPGKGTGLGLSIVYEIITNKHNGELLVESKNGNGTKFTIKIPY